MLRRRAVGVLAGWLLGFGGLAQADESKNTELGVSRVALFNSGVGFFECQGTVDGDATTELKFRTEQINDILKSLVIQDFGGGSIGVVSYASRDPIEKTLRSFGVDITGKPSLAQLLDQLRGEPVEISGDTRLEGVIVGVEKRRVVVKDQAVDVDVVTILTATGLQQVETARIGGIKLKSEKVEGELKKALATLASAHDADKKSVIVSFNGKGARKVRAAYLLDAPIWKTSYRLVLSDDKKPFLQGWATVENATEEDWNNIRLSLVSGRPISFRMDLYTPIYIPRPIEQLELYASLRPPEFEGGFAAEEKKSDKDAAAGRRVVAADAAPAASPRMKAGASLGGRGRAGGTGGGNLFQDQNENADDESPRLGLELRESGVHSVADAKAAGELFEYTIQAPVSIPRQHSAMLPIVNEEIEGEKVSIYNPGSHPKHPLNGLELKNVTKLNLMQGPVTLFDANVYAGDAKLPDLKPAEKRLIAYALDLGCEVNVKQQPTPDEIISLQVKRGILWHRHKYVDTREYEIKNKTDKEKKVIIEQGFSEDWKLIEPKDPYERTPNLLRFKVAAAAQKTTAHKVVSERIADQTVGLAELDFDSIKFYLKSKVISPKVREAMERVVALRTELDDAARKRGQLEQQVNEASAEQGRVRQNITSLPQNSDAYKRQVSKLDSIETQIETLRNQIAEARQTEETKRQALQEYLVNLNVE